MRIILVGGGTSGHINPALNIAEYVREMDKNAEILYVGSRSGTEENLAKKSNLNFHGITVSGFSNLTNGINAFLRAKWSSADSFIPYNWNGDKLTANAGM